jgi:hypothetical protein
MEEGSKDTNAAAPSSEQRKIKKLNELIQLKEKELSDSKEKEELWKEKLERQQSTTAKLEEELKQLRIYLENALLKQENGRLKGQQEEKEKELSKLRKDLEKEKKENKEQFLKIQELEELQRKLLFSAVKKFLKKLFFFF